MCAACTCVCPISHRSEWNKDRSSIAHLHHGCIAIKVRLNQNRLNKKIFRENAYTSEIIKCFLYQYSKIQERWRF